MHQLAIVLTRALSPAVGVLLGLLGFATLGENLLGWLLFIAGVAYAAGTIIVAYVLRKDSLESRVAGARAHASSSAWSHWLLTAGMVAIFFLSPLEYLYFGAKGLPVSWLELGGAGLACLGGVAFAWARRNLGASYEGHLSSAQDAPVRQGGPYRFVRHPADFGYLLAALGLALGYGSVWGMAALLVLLVPAVLWRIRVEDQALSARFGAEYRQYAARTKRLIPGIW